MNTEFPVDWWRHELYRSVAHFVHDPGDRTQARLDALIAEFRRRSERRRPGLAPDEHEYAMNFC